jgi:predicted glycosyl hydrolase (DUF1957 family)
VSEQCDAKDMRDYLIAVNRAEAAEAMIEQIMGEADRAALETVEAMGPVIEAAVGVWRDRAEAAEARIAELTALVDEFDDEYYGHWSAFAEFIERFRAITGRAP